MPRKTLPVQASDTRCWRAVQTRRSAADGSFVYAVRTTKIYCRPSCPSKRPQRNRVVFFCQPQDAERAGYRPCLRCLPQFESPQRDSARRVLQICRRIEATLAADPEKRLTSLELSRFFGLEPQKMERLFRKALGITPKQFTDAQRMAQLKSKLRKGDKVTTAMYDAGYGSSSRLYERAPAQMGMTPATYRRGGAGMNISYTIVPSPLGRLLVAATRRGVSAVYLGGADAPLEKALAGEYPQAEIRRDAKGFEQWVRKILRNLRGQEPHIDLPLDVQATAFQRRVWEELRRIPYGATRSYTEVARAIGKPRAIRAVARACATNPVSIVVPCHRVVREDGNLAGYRWGLDRKSALLAQEKKVAPRAK
ncbi:MAG TPA: bifunctional DNA-binding transcriptional regulator/O6-methylguanine-DNA methyltransferase Ada [Candidatus Limnocylindrales bacterium]|nr:bifunctional DNA-binding transcriptional regulator/O6-methylguanine-DNA methyltransferase Ada [Candidatus Limnocylindrales bacterium]